MPTNALRPLSLIPLPLGAIRPAGWLLRQLRIQADGLTGHLDEFWPDVAKSDWIGLKGDGWERGPYWLDGVVPLAFLLDDPDLKRKVAHWMDYILTHQHADGWLGAPIDPAKPNYDPWPIFIFLKAATQYYDATCDARVIPAMEKALRRIGELLDQRPMFDWNRFRWADGVLSIHWLYDRTGQSWLLDLAAKFHAQGYDWRGNFEAFRFTGRIGKDQLDAFHKEAQAAGKPNDNSMACHVVNNAMAVKTPGVWSRQSGEPADIEGGRMIIATLDRYHGQANGVFSGDEHLATQNPSQGTELCAVVEYLFSLEVLLAISGTADLADRLEQIAYNAMPATFTPDMWAHQYDQQVNQAQATVEADPVYTNNRGDSNIYGLEPNFGCCTANMHQGWPKFAAHLWMATPEGGLAALAYAPCTVSARLADQDVLLAVQTDYPFNDTITIRILAGGEKPWPMRLRIPAWTKKPQLQINGQDAAANFGADGEARFITVTRAWQTGDVVTLRLPMPVRAQSCYNGAVSIHRGPLLYALRIGEAWKRIAGELPHADWEVRPTTPWNYALQIDPAQPEKAIQFAQRRVGDLPFSPDGAPVVATVKACRVEGWQLDRGAAAPPPPSPVHATGPVETVELIPYGCTNLRMGVLPVVRS